MRMVGLPVGGARVEGDPQAAPFGEAFRAGDVQVLPVTLLVAPIMLSSPLRPRVSTSLYEKICNDLRSVAN
jgi:hypothetical protein